MQWYKDQKPCWLHWYLDGIYICSRWNPYIELIPRRKLLLVALISNLYISYNGCNVIYVDVHFTVFWFHFLDVNPSWLHRYLVETHYWFHWYLDECCYITVDPATPTPWNRAPHFGVLLNRPRCLMLPSLKGAQVWDFWPIFFTPKKPIWVGDLRTGENFFFFRRLRQIFAIFFFFTQAEPALIICLRRLSLR